MTTPQAGGAPPTGGSGPAGSEPPAIDPVGEWLSRFDAGEALELRSDGQTESLVGVIPPVPTPGTGAYALDPGRLLIQYQGGTVEERWARILDSAEAPGNRILRFSLIHANVLDDDASPEKGRVQLNAYDAEVLRSREVRFSTRMYLHPSFDSLRALRQSFDWLTLAEWWNNAGWTGQPFPFRIVVDVTKPLEARGTPLRFAVRAESLNEATRKWDIPVWRVTNLQAQVPVGQWVTVEYYFREGNASQGRFYMAIVPDGGTREVLFDIRNWTHHPSDPAPDGITHLNPLKLYTSKAVIDAARNAGSALTVDWDDLTFRLCREGASPAATSPCDPAAIR